MSASDFQDPRLTEQRNPRTGRIDVASSLEIVDLINAEDALVAPALRAVREHIARAIDLAVTAFARSGRLLYAGAGTSGRLGVLDASECPPTFGTPPGMVVGIIAGGYPALVKSVEGAEDDVNAAAAAIDEAGVTAADFVLGIAASGTTPFVRAARRARGRHRLHAHEGRHRDQAGAEHYHHGGDDPARQGVWESDDRFDCDEREAARPGRADRHGVLRRGPGSGPRGDRGSGRQREARHRHGAARRGAGGGGAGARGGGRTGPPGDRRSAAGRVSATLGVGVMSGTSLDGVATALVTLSDTPLDAQLVAFRQEPYSATERGQIVDAIARGGARDLALLPVALGERFAGAVLQLLAAAKVAPRDVGFVACHGQTVWHEPGRATLQLGDPAVLAERIGVRVVSDFRARDVAAGGQGAPLVPLADVMLFGHPERGRLLLNLGGMANVTWVPRRGVTAGAIAFDTGPGVAVIDAVTRRLDPDLPFDRDGERARGGRPMPRALDTLLGDPYFAASPPKSTGRERFGLEFADRLIELVREAGGSDNDAIATATALSAEAVGRAIERWIPAGAA